MEQVQATICTKYKNTSINNLLFRDSSIKGTKQFYTWLEHNVSEIQSDFTKEGTIISFNEMTHKSVGQFALISLDTSYLKVLKSFSPLHFFKNVNVLYQ